MKSIHPLLWSRLIVALLLFGGTLGYFLTEETVVLRVVAILLLLIGFLFLFIRRRIAFPVLLALYFISVAVSSWSFGATGPLWLGLLIVVGSGTTLSWVLFMNEGKELSLLDAAVIVFLTSEVFLTYSFYQVNPTAIGILLLAFFYCLWGVLLLTPGKSTRGQSLSYLGLGAAVTLITLVTTQLIR